MPIAMARSQQRVLSQLASSPNELASGLGQCLEALRLISALPRASPVFVQYGSASSPMIKAFGREHLSRVPLRTVITLIKSSMNLPDNLYVASVIFYREDGTIDPSQVLLDEDSWKELAPYVHTLHVEDRDRDRDRDVCLSYDRPSTALSALSINSGPTSSVGSGSGSGKTSLNSNASTFVPSTQISIKTSDGAKVSLQNLRKPSSSFSPSSPQATSPFAILDNTGSCV